jgi:hypothetical protein
MSLSNAGSPSHVPPEVLAIAVALAAEWQAAEEAESPPEDQPRRWKWSGRTWERPASHRWS